MFCPKCGSQNADETKFCRGCGADLSSVLAVVDGTPREPLSLAEKRLDLFSSGLRGLMIGLGFLIVAGVGLGISTRLAALSIFLSAFAVFFLGTGVSRLVHSRAIKRLRESDVPRANPALSPGEAEYIKPSRLFYETDDLVLTPRSVTENTTRHLQMDPEGDELASPKKGSSE